MSLDADNMIARRKMRHRVSFWRAICVSLGIVTLVAVAYGSNGQGFSLGKRGDHIARIRVEGMITGDTRTLDMLREIEKAKQVKALLVHIDSPGGTTAGSEAIYERMRVIARDRPVVAVMNTVAASGGYITAIAADHIVARGNTITGSIGVIFQWAQVKQLLSNIGITMQERKSGALKAEPNMFSDPTDETLAVTDEMIRDSFDWFTGLVKERRQLSAPQMTLISDGRVFTGRQALTAKLVDGLGGEDEAIDWLNAEHKIDKEMKVVDWQPAPAPGTGGLGLFGINTLARWLGFSAAVDAFEAHTVKLDGLLVLWHPDLR